MDLWDIMPDRMAFYGLICSQFVPVSFRHSFFFPSYCSDWMCVHPKNNRNTSLICFFTGVQLLLMSNLTSVEGIKYTIATIKQEPMWLKQSSEVPKSIFFVRAGTFSRFTDAGRDRGDDPEPGQNIYWQMCFKGALLSWSWQRKMPCCWVHLQFAALPNSTYKILTF